MRCPSAVEIAYTSLSYRPESHSTRPSAETPAHVGRSTRYRPRRHDRAGGEVDDADGPGVAVRHVEVLRVAARVQAVRAATRGQECHHDEGLRIDLPHTAVGHVGDVEQRAVGRELHVLRPRERPRQRDRSAPPTGRERRSPRGRRRTRNSRAPANRRRVKSMWSIPRHGTDTDFTRLIELRIPEVESLLRLGHDDRVPSVGSEIQVVRIGHRDRGAAHQA